MSRVGNWVRRSTDSRGVDWYDLCGQCFPDGWDTVAADDVTPSERSVV
ncbi:hypothetical protein NDI85_11700 [Halomicroarcula sp. S1AR25-4]|nr:hypothetical protein [Halomicroarcula sp. S1AR25-4]